MAHLSRRAFLSKSLTQVAGTGLSVHVTQGGPAEDRIGAGIIGTNHSHAVGHLRAIRRSKDYHLLAVAEPIPELYAKAKSDPRWAGVKWTSVDALLAHEAIRMVCIETDPLDALLYARLAVNAGKHTKIDKPPGADLGLLERILQDARQRRCVVQMGYIYRYDPAFRLAHRALQEGWLGQVRSVVCQMNDPLTPEGRRRLDRYPGGQMFEICGHMIDMLIWLLGGPVRVTPVLRHSDPIDDELEDDVLATFEFEPAVAVVKSHTRNGDRYFHLFGDRGSILIDSPSRPQVTLVLSEARGGFKRGVQRVEFNPPERFVLDLEDLAGAIRENRWVEFFTPENDLAVHRALLAACGVSV